MLGPPFAFSVCGSTGDLVSRFDLSSLVVMPDFENEAALILSGAQNIAGVDEVGRGPLAGPVVAAAVILDPNAIPEGLNDSKALNARQRKNCFERISTTSLVSLGQASVEEIDALNILRASHLAMMRALDGLGEIDHALIDGNMIPNGLNCPATALVKGDARSLSIAAASIVAKVTRDKIMVDLSQQFPGYGWDKNAGYPTKAHREALVRLGVTPHHRRSFKPVHNML